LNVSDFALGVCTQAARQLEVLSQQGPLAGAQSTLATLEAASAVNQHHDAVSARCLFYFIFQEGALTPTKTRNCS
jgi:hypothetical protein